MSVVEHPRERAWNEGEASTLALMGTINLAVARLVATIGMLIDTGGWGGHGIRSVEHWVTWKAGVSHRRAEDLARIARRIDELPACWALFEAGCLTEDAMVRIARRVPTERDAEVAGWAPGMLISQLTRALASCPELPNPADADKPDEPREAERQERYLRMSDDPDGWGHGEFCLPPDEMAQLRAALELARDAEFRDRNNLDLDADVVSSGSITWADALIRLAGEGLDALDTTLARTGRRGERTKVILHHDINPHATLGPGQLHLGAVIPDPVARYLSCDAEVLVAAYVAGQLIGINPTDRTVSRSLRRIIERRDQGCAHPCAPRPAGFTSTTSSTGHNAGSPSPRTSCACAPPTTASFTTTSSASKATPRPARCGSSTHGGARSNHPNEARPAHSAPTSPAPTPHPTANASTPAGSAGTNARAISSTRRRQPQSCHRRETQ